jgi:acetylornithine deacetylase/succinyl-diaminopimelate desuccinylase-like protein
MRAVSTVIGIQILHLTANAVIGGFVDIGGSIIALVGTAEKGHTNTRVRVETPGGHSSVPPAHTVRCDLSLIDFI